MNCSSFFFFHNFVITILLVLATQLILTRAFLDPVDFLALQSIRKSLSDLPGSNYLSTWDFTSDPCNFAGIYCAGDKVIALNLGDPRAGSSGLTGRISPAVGKLTALTELTIVPGRVYGSLPRTLSQLKNLRFLAISRNYITGQIPPGLGQLRGLRTLDLSFNQISGNIPLSIARLPGLSNVLLTRNRLTGPVPHFYSRTLTRLDLKHNYLSGWIPSNGLPPSLNYLSLSKNRLSGPVDRVLSRLRNLNYVDLSFNQFTGHIPGVIFGFPISSLQLQRNRFYGPVRPARPVRISTVDLSYNRLSGTLSPMFSTVQNLYLNNNMFSGEVPGSIVDQVLSGSIQTLYLQHNFLTGFRINPTLDIPVSTSLCLQYNCMVLPIQTPCPIKAERKNVTRVNVCETK